MREILFKAKRIDNGEWVEGYYLQDKILNSKFIKDRTQHLIATLKKETLSETIKTGFYEIDYKTLSEYTGLKDKHGNKVFENDILWADGSYELTVSWDDENARFYAEYQGHKSGHEDDDNDDYAEACDFATYEIIGNNFDNKELVGE